MEMRVLPALDAFAPELILVSAGFDAHKADPLSQRLGEAQHTIQRPHHRDERPDL